MKILKNTDNIVKNYYVKVSKYILYNEELRKLGFKTAAMALADQSVSLDDARLKAENKLAIIMGTEGDGLPQKAVDEADYVVRIPMMHNVDSLNVAAASAVAFWELRRDK